ncbi:hypothetical protein FB470_003039 [Amycolatopsis thermophila]|uniref:Uncharacterized protein n=1 Tax=Amycolatopsis thermophila TaxID=206084 RepID=A0ABU0EVZ2_9PSEU|nr:hypothetical protein [Amycolatopsis thermophila]
MGQSEVKPMLADRRHGFPVVVIHELTLVELLPDGPGIRH